MARKAKIICTLGPSSFDEDKIESLIDAGMNIARLNFSHGTHDFYRVLINRIRHVAAKLNKPVAILQDLQGPKIRISKMLNDAAEIKSGKKIFITNKDILGTPEAFSCDYSNIINDIQEGDPILIDDGKIILRCFEKNAEQLQCYIEVGGIIKSHKGINLPKSATSLPSLTLKDIKDLHFGAQAQVDAVALSFVRSLEDIQCLKNELALTKTKPLIIAKLEKPQAINDLDNIIQASDGVMVARGDLGVEVPPENVPLIQKTIIEKASFYGKSVAVATEMLESMISQSRPTRAESSDVANAVLDGADMLTLSAETAIGKFPCEVVKTMDKIIVHVENSDRYNYSRSHTKKISSNKEIPNTIAFSAVQTCELLDASAIVMFTNSGAIARMVSNCRPTKPIIAFVPNIFIQRSLSFYWGVKAIVLEAPGSTSKLLDKINEKLLELNEVKAWDKVVVLTKIPLLPSFRTNTIHIHTIKPVLISESVT